MPARPSVLARAVAVVGLIGLVAVACTTAIPSRHRTDAATGAMASSGVVTNTRSHVSATACAAS